MHVKCDKNKVLVGLSGGVDSSVTIHLLQQQGFLVEALYICFSKEHEKGIEKAQLIARQTEVPFHLVRCYELFDQMVIEPFCEQYCIGQTPNPCIICNPEVKFKVLKEKADELSIYYISTGHYARVCEIDGRSYISPALSLPRDQSYMLYRLPSEILDRLVLPLGEFTKQHIRSIAKQLNLASADTKDSQEICFIKDEKYPQFIKERGYEALGGHFIMPNGEKAAKHNGVDHYTIGQRRGIGISYKQAMFIKEILPSGDIVLDVADNEFNSNISINDLAFNQNFQLYAGLTIVVKIRSAGTLNSAVIKKVNENELQIEFEIPVRAPAKGQSAVFYLQEQNILIGGGIICSVQ